MIVELVLEWKFKLEMKLESSGPYQARGCGGLIFIYSRSARPPIIELATALEFFQTHTFLSCVHGFLLNSQKRTCSSKAFDSLF